MYYNAKGNLFSIFEPELQYNKVNMNSDHRNLVKSVTTRTSFDDITVTTYTYSYDDNGNRISKVGGGINEYYLYDQTGKQVAIYDMNYNRIKSANMYGANGLIGNIDYRYTLVTDVNPDTGKKKLGIM